MSRGCVVAGMSGGAVGVVVAAVAMTRSRTALKRSILDFSITLLKVD